MPSKIKLSFPIVLSGPKLPAESKAGQLVNLLVYLLELA